MTIQSTRRDDSPRKPGGGGAERPRHSGMGSSRARAGRDASCRSPTSRRTSRFEPRPEIGGFCDIRTIDGPFTPKDKFATTQHYGHPDVDPATFKLKVSGLVDRPKALSLDDLKKMGSTDLVAGFECSGNRGAAPGAVRQRQVDRRAAEDGARCGRREGGGARVRLLRRRSRRRGNRVAHAEVQARSAVRPQPQSREGDVGRTVPRLGAERRAAHEASGLAAASARAGLVRRRERQVAGADPRAGRRLPGQVPGALVPHAARRDDRRRDEVEGDRRHAHEAEVVHRARHQDRQPATRCSASC